MSFSETCILKTALARQKDVKKKLSLRSFQSKLPCYYKSTCFRTRKAVLNIKENISTKIKCKRNNPVVANLDRDVEWMNTKPLVGKQMLIEQTRWFCVWNVVHLGLEIDFNIFAVID
jgi:hypothetical protein